MVLIVRLDRDDDGSVDLGNLKQALKEADTDGDGSGNHADSDDDNDGMPDSHENDAGNAHLNPLNAADAIDHAPGLCILNDSVSILSGQRFLSNSFSWN